MSITKSKWEELTLNSDNAYFFHSPLWVKILEKTYNFHNATRIFKINGKEVLVPMVKSKKYGFKSYYSIPFGYGGFISNDVLLPDEIKEITDEIIDKLIGGRNIIFDFATPPLSNLSFDFIKSSINQLEDRWNYTNILFLNKNFDYIWKNKFKKKNRQHIRRAKRNNITIRKANSLDDFKEYYNIYSKSSKKWGYKTPPQPLDLYKNMYKYGSNYVNLDLALKDNKIIAGNLTLNYGNTIMGWSNSILEEYNSLNPMRLLICNSIKCACNEGYKIYNMGSSGDLSGVKKFKEGFGSEIIRTNRYRAFSNLGKLIFNIYKKK